MIFKLKRFIALALSLAILLASLSLLSVVEAQENGPTITAVSPSYGWTDEEPYLYIEGYGFEEPLTVTLNSMNSTNFTPLTVYQVQPELIIAIVPLGMIRGSYDVTVQMANGASDTKYAAYTVFDHSNKDDLTSSSDWLWTEPRTLRVNGPVNRGVGINLQRLGGFYENGVLEVTVKFVERKGIEDEPLGEVIVPFVPPKTVIPTEKVIWEPETAGTHTICAIIDPDNEITEINPEEANGGEGNNVICRNITVLPDDPDKVAPIVLQNKFKINSGESNTPDVAVRLDVEAEDALPNPRSGIEAIYFIEYEYSATAETWVPVEKSGWIPYPIAHENYPYSLHETYGVRYMLAWAIDKAGNISRDSKIEDINLLPSEQTDFVGEDKVDFYRIYVEEGETLSTTLRPITGNPDLYIWLPSGQRLNDEQQSGIESVSFSAPELGTYQIEVHGFTDAEYHLSFEVTNGSGQTYRVSQDCENKPCPINPIVSVSDVPLDVYVNPPAPLLNNIYLPMTTR